MPIGISINNFFHKRLFLIKIYFFSYKKDNLHFRSFSLYMVKKNDIWSLVEMLTEPLPAGISKSVNTCITTFCGGSAIRTTRLTHRQIRVS